MECRDGTAFPCKQNIELRHPPQYLLILTPSQLSGVIFPPRLLKRFVTGNRRQALTTRGVRHRAAPGTEERSTTKKQATRKKKEAKTVDLPMVLRPGGDVRVGLSLARGFQSLALLVSSPSRLVSAPSKPKPTMLSGEEDDEEEEDADDSEGTLRGAAVRSLEGTIVRSWSSDMSTEAHAEGTDRESCEEGGRANNGIVKLPGRRVDPVHPATEAGGRVDRTAAAIDSSMAFSFSLGVGSLAEVRQAGDPTSSDGVDVDAVDALGGAGVLVVQNDKQAVDYSVPGGAGEQPRGVATASAAEARGMSAEITARRKPFGLIPPDNEVELQSAASSEKNDEYRTPDWVRGAVVLPAGEDVSSGSPLSSNREVSLQCLEDKGRTESGPDDSPLDVARGDDLPAVTLEWGRTVTLEGRPPTFRSAGIDSGSVLAANRPPTENIAGQVDAVAERLSRLFTLPA